MRALILVPVLLLSAPAMAAKLIIGETTPIDPTTPQRPSIEVFMTRQNLAKPYELETKQTLIPKIIEAATTDEVSLPSFFHALAEGGSPSPATVAVNVTLTVARTNISTLVMMSRNGMMLSSPPASSGACSFGADSRRILLRCCALSFSAILASSTPYPLVLRAPQ